MFLGPGHMLYVGALGATAEHAHHAHQIVIATEGLVSLRDASGTQAATRAALVGPDIPHSIAAPCAQAMLLYLEPDGSTGRRLRLVSSGGAQAPQWVQAAVNLSALPLPVPALPAEAADVVRRVVDALVPETARPEPRHPAVTRALAQIALRLECGEVGLEALAKEAGISSSRLSHLFKQHVGIPLRPYVLWRRMMRAAEGVRDGATLTTAAHAAGFSDSAHMNHVFKRTFGLSPSEGVGAIAWATLPAE